MTSKNKVSDLGHYAWFCFCIITFFIGLGSGVYMAYTDLIEMAEIINDAELSKIVCINESKTEIYNNTNYIIDTCKYELLEKEYDMTIACLRGDINLN